MRISINKIALFRHPVVALIDPASANAALYGTPASFSAAYLCYCILFKCPVLNIFGGRHSAWTNDYFNEVVHAVGDGQWIWGSDALPATPIQEWGRGPREGNLRVSG